ncbi:MAG: hypothetical protein IPK22_06190 [Verrucomicrobiaceae bacterium]|nr:hypothetical protein [Verrucomicrobiaceae bacterium]
MNEPSESDAETPEKRVKRRRMRHEWREASNPLDQLVQAVGWLFFISVLASLAYYGWQAAFGKAD